MLFLAALASFPPELSEAARLDGAGERAIFWRIKLPRLFWLAVTTRPFLYVATSLPVSIFILAECMRQIPKELEEAAVLDGCGPFAVFFRIFLPLSGPGLSTVAIDNAIILWNEFIFAYVLTSSPRNRTLPLAVWDFQGQYMADIPAILAVVTLTSPPLIVAYAFGQERIVKGMMAGSLKG